MHGSRRHTSGGCSVTDRFWYDPNGENQRQLEFEQNMLRWEAHTGSYSYSDALNLAATIRENPGVGPDTAAAIGANGNRWDAPALSQIIALDHRQQSFTQRALTEVIGPVTRIGISAFYDFYDQGIAKPIRMGTRMLQGESTRDAFINSGIGIGGETVLNKRLGNDVTLGEGILPGQPREPLMAPGASDVLIEQMEAGTPLPEAITYTEQWVTDNHAVNVFNSSRDVNESTMLHSTRDGVTKAYHLTPGRAVMQPLAQVIEPETMPWKFLTGMADFTMQVALDPNNPLFFKLTKIARARNRAVGSVRGMKPDDVMAETAEALGGRKILKPEITKAPDGTTKLPQIRTDSVEGLTFQGTADELVDGVVDTGGFTLNPKRAEEFAGPNGRVNVFNIEDMPEAVKAQLAQGDIEQYISDPALAAAFDIEPVELIGLQRQYFEAVENQRLAEDLIAGIRGVEPEYYDDLDLVMKAFYDDSDEVLEALSERGFNVSGTKDPNLAFREWRAQMSLVLDEGELAALDDALGTWKESALEYRNNEIFGTAVEKSDAQRHLVQRLKMHDGGVEVVFGAIDEPIVSSASFSRAEWSEMQQMGYVFDSREQWDLMSSYLDEIKEAGGVKVKGRWLEHPMTWERYIDKPKGQKFVRYLADNDAFAAAPRLPGMSEADIAYIGLIKDQGEITKILKHWYGTPQSRFKVPKASAPSRALNAWRINADAGARASSSIWERAGSSRLSQYGRRLVAQMGDNAFDPYNLGVNHEIIRNYGDLLGVSEMKMNDAFMTAMDDVPQHEAYLRDFGRRVGIDTEQYKLEQLRVSELPIRTPAERMNELQDKVFQWIKDDLVTKGHDDAYANRVVAEWRNSAARNRQYADNAAAQPIVLNGAPGRKIVNARTGETSTMMPSEPLLDSQLSSRSYFMPSMRDVRRVTAKMRDTTEYMRARLGKSEVGIGTSGLQKGVDGVISTWRNLALLRAGWMFRVVPDEMARFYAYGYSDIATNPLAMLFMSIGYRGDILPNGDSLRATYELMGLGAENGIYRGLDDLPYVETGMRGANWNSTDAIVRHADGTPKINANGHVQLTDKGAQGIARRVLQLNQSRLAQVVMDENTLEEAIQQLLYTVEGRKILREIGQRTDETTAIGRATIAPEIGSTQAVVRTTYHDAADLLDELDALVDTYHLGAAEGVSRNQARWTAVVLNGDELTEGSAKYLDDLVEELAGKKVAEMTQDEFMSYIDSELLARVGRHLDEADGPLPDLDKVIPGARTDADQEASLRTLLEAINAQVEQYSGGHWIARGDDGRWFNDIGKEVEAYVIKDYQTGVRWTRQELIDKLKERNLLGPRGGDPHGSLPNLRAQLLTDDGMPADLATRTEGYIVTKNGTPEIRELIHTGKYLNDADTLTASSRASRELFGRISGDLNRGDYVYVVRGIDDKRGRFVSQFDELQERVLAAEKVSDPADWTDAQRAAYDSGDWETFSRLRGYTDEEIADYGAYLDQIGTASADAVQQADGSISAEALYDLNLGDTERAYRDLSEAAGKLGRNQYVAAIRKEDMPPSTFIGGKGSATRIEIPRGMSVAETSDEAQIFITKQMLDNEIDTIIGDGAIPYIQDDMMRSDFQALEARLADSYSQDYMPVERVSVPDKPYLNANDEKGVIDELFRIIGRDPSMFAVRRPFVTLRTWELLADHAITGTPALRAKIIAAAQDTGMGVRFTRFMDDALQARGWSKPQTLANHIDDMDEIVGLAWSEAVLDTKDLFYDLTKGGAWQDATRLVFPFADAWWEVLSRWTHLMNPLNTGGSPFKLARRGSQLFYAAESSGWFDYDSQGERVFGFPGSASMFNMVNQDSAMKFLPQVSAAQLAFVDFGDPSQAGAPGVSPFVQTTASLVRPIIPPSMKPMYDKVIYRGFSPTELSVSGTVGAFMPTWVRRVFATIYDDEYERKYAAIAVRATNVFAQSSDVDVATNKQAALDVAQEGQDVASWLAPAEIFSSFITPAQPRNVVGLVKWDEDGNESVKSVGAIAADFALLQSMYGQDEAIAYMMNMYDVNPLKFAPTTWSSQKFPHTRESFIFLENHDGLIKNTPYTLMAWIPPDDGNFYGDAWNAAFREGILERLSPEDAINYMSHIAGQHRMSAVRERRDAILEGAEQRYGGKDNDSYRYVRDEVITPWYNDETRNINTQYWGWDPKGGITGLTARPTYRKTFNELREIANPKTQAYVEALAVDPELHGFVTFLVEQWDEFTDLALALGKSDSWWSTGTSETTGAPQIRAAYVQNINTYLSRLSGESRDKAEWMSNTLIAPLLEGYGWDDPIVIVPTMPSNEQIGYADKLGER